MWWPNELNIRKIKHNFALHGYCMTLSQNDILLYPTLTCKLSAMCLHVLLHNYQFCQFFFFQGRRAYYEGKHEEACKKNRVSRNMSISSIITGSVITFILAILVLVIYYTTSPQEDITDTTTTQIQNKM